MTKNDTVNMVLKKMCIYFTGLWFYFVFHTYDDRLGFKICLAVAPVLTSVHWWENYVHEGKTQALGIPRLARNVKKFRTKLMLYSNIWKMMLAIVTPIALFGINCNEGSECIDVLYFTRDRAILHSTIGEVELISEKKFNNCNSHLPLIVAAIGVLAGGMCFKIAKVGCKIMTQVMDYSLPLVLSTPAALGVVIAMYGGFITISADEVSCHLPFPSWSKDNGAADFFTLMIDDTNNLYLMGAALCGFLSLVLVTNHIWMPGKERLQRTDK